MKWSWQPYLLLSFFVLSACGQASSSLSSSSTSNSSSTSSSTSSSSDASSSLSLSSLSSVDEVDYETSMTWQQSGRLYIHYNRSTEEQPAALSDYQDWAIWAWQKSPFDLSGVLIDWSFIDQSGVVAELDFSSTTVAHVGHLIQPNQVINEVTRVGFLIVQKSSMSRGLGMWTSDGGTDMYINDFNTHIRPNGTMHIFALTGRVSEYTFDYTGAIAVDPYANDTGQFESMSNVNSSNINNFPQAITSQDFYHNVGVGYQIFVRSFADSDGNGEGDIRGIIEKLDYIEALGSKVIWLTPINTSETYHGYDVSDYYGIAPQLGSALDFAELVYKAREKDIRIMMDLVVNHTSTQNAWFQNAVNLRKGVNLRGEEIDYRNFYHFQYHPTHTDELGPAWHRFSTSNYYYYGKFATSMPELNFDYQGTRDAMVDVAKYWLALGVGGFRIDAVKHVYMADEVPSESGDVLRRLSLSDPYQANQTKNLNFFKEFNYRIKSVYPDAMIVGENYDGWDERIAPYYEALDSQLDFQHYFHLQNMFYGLEPGVSHPQSQAYKFETKYNSVFTPYRPQFINAPFTSNHDLPRVPNYVMGSPENGGVTAKTVLTVNDYQQALPKAMLHNAATILMPGLSWIYYGDELGMTGNVSVNQDGTNFHQDRFYRQPFKWSTQGSSYDTEYTFEGYQIEWDSINRSSSVLGALEQQNSVTSMHRLVSTLAQLKHQESEMINARFEAFSTGVNNGQVMSYRLVGRTKTFYIYLNFGSNNAAIPSLGTATLAQWNNATSTNLPGYSVLVRR